MASYYWNADVSGVFGTATNWKGGVAPGSGGDVILAPAGTTAFTVTTQGGYTINSIQTAANATLDIAKVDAFFTITNGTGNGVNAGTIADGLGGDLQFGGVMDNTGTITLNGSGAHGFSAVVLLGTATLNGGGHVTLSDAAYNSIDGFYIGGLINVDNTISGGGSIGAGSSLDLTNQSKGVIDATGTHYRLVIQTAGFTNAGLLETTGAAGMSLKGSGITNTGTVAALGSGALTVQEAIGGGVVTMASGGQVTLAGGTIDGGGAASVGGGGLITLAGGTINGGASLSIAAGGSLTSSGAANVIAAGTVANAGVIGVGAGSTLSISGAIGNTGSIALNGSTTATSLLIAAATTLGGGGAVLLTDSSFNHFAEGGGATSLTNVDNSVSGAGTIGAGSLTLVNQAKGIIDATGTLNALVLDLASGSSNAGLIETTGAAGMTLENISLANTGTVAAVGAGALTISKATVGGGTVTTASGGQIDLAGGTISGTGVFSDAGTLTGSGVVADTLSNSGSVIASGGTLNLSGANLTNLSGSTLTGGVFGADAGAVLQLANNSAIATLAGTVELAGAGSVVQSLNTLTSTQVQIEASLSSIAATGALQLSGGRSFVVKNPVLINSGQIDLTGATLTGGVTTTSGGQIVLSGGTVLGSANPFTLDAGASLTSEGADDIGAAIFINQGAVVVTNLAVGHLTVTGSLVNEGSITVQLGTGITLGGQVNNSGTVALYGGYGPASLAFSGATTLSGGGAVVLASTANNQVSATGSLTNIDNTISGMGTINLGGALLINEAKGVIDANAGGGLVVDFGGGSSNAGLIESSGAGGLTLNGGGGGTLVNTGTVAAYGTGTLAIIGGTISGGAFQHGATTPIYIDSGGVNIASALAVDAGETLAVTGFNNITASSFINQGVVTVGAGYSFLYAPATNAGTMVVNTGARLTLEETLANTGTITLVGGGRVVGYLANSGLVTGYGAANATITNTGAIIASGGTLRALGTLNDLAGTILTDGTLGADAGATLILAINSTLATLGGTLELNGAGSVVESYSTTSLSNVQVDSTLASITSTGALEILGGRDFSAAGPLASSGLIQLGGGTLSGGAITDAAGATLAGFGVVAASVTGAGAVDASGGTLALTASSDTFGAAASASTIAAGATLLAQGAVSIAGTVHNNGALAASGATLTLTGAVLGGAQSALDTTAGGQVTLANGASAQIAGASTNGGTIALQSASTNTDLRVLAAGATLSGGGVVSLGGTKARVLGATAASTLTNVDNTLTGTGFIGANTLTLINQSKGVIDAVGAFGLTVGTKGETLTNQGLMEATGGGILIIANTTVANLGGTILATNGSPVDLQDDVVRGGGITASGTGVVKVNVAGGELDGTTNAVSLSGVAFIVNGSNETLEGSIANAGKINLIASTSTSDLIIGAAGASLSGGGQVNMTNSVKNRIYGLASGDTLTNVDNRIDGAGLIGNGVMTLVNKTAGQIVGNQNLALTIDTGTNIITNAGLIENVGKGGTLVKSAVNNTGTLLAATAGTLTLAGAVTGAGIGQINGGTLYVQQAFAENVTFSGTTGVLELGDSQAFTGKVTGLSHSGTSWLDLVDIGFFAAKTKATYSGTTASGTLTVTDGTHTAHITLQGNYLSATWTVSGDGHGGTKVVDPSGGSGSNGPSAAPLAQAAAGFTASAGGGRVETIAIPISRPAIVALPHTQFA